MTDSRAQVTYQVRLGWGTAGLTQLAPSEIVVVVDAIGRPDALAQQAKALPHAPAVFVASLRNATATAQAVYQEQLERGGRTSINLVLAGDNGGTGHTGDGDGSTFDGGFAVEDYLTAGAIADALTTLGIDHSAPDVAVATEGFRPLKRAVKHLFSASASGLALKAEGRGAEAKAAAELDADPVATRV